ncbi:MAG: hypothetical protein BJ554DRAFT_6582, partial [Olpidium bornovanus]
VCPRPRLFLPERLREAKFEENRFEAFAEREKCLALSRHYIAPVQLRVTSGIVPSFLWAPRDWAKRPGRRALIFQSRRPNTHPRTSGYPATVAGRVPRAAPDTPQKKNKKKNERTKSPGRFLSMLNWAAVLLHRAKTQKPRS